MNAEQNNVEEVRINMNPNIVSERKNDGTLGPVCNNCGGYGFTVALKGGRLPCKPCEETGARLMSQREFQTILMQQVKDNAELRKAVLATLHGTLPETNEDKHNE